VEADGGLVIALAGAIDEHCGPKDIVPRVASHVILDLDGIERVTSYGVINWLAAMKTLEGKQYAFARCRPSIVRQFNMITGFGRKGMLLSLYLPYFCATCSDEYEFLLDLTLDFGPVRTRTPPSTRCPKCGTTGEFDDAAETYFNFGADHSEPRLSAGLHKVLRELGRLPPIDSYKYTDHEVKSLQVLRAELGATADRLAKRRGERDS
jgi:DNA-directed RNA polymerase subunit RPC12/RpoP